MIAREGAPLILTFAGGAIIGFFIHAALFFLFGFLFILTVLFFRDPDRKIRAAPNDVLSPADGRIIGIEAMNKAPYLLGACTKISIFLSLGDVHVNRSPIEGRIGFLKYSPGKFHAAFTDKSSVFNESNWIGITAPQFTILMRQIAGAVARRIVCTCKEGQAIRQGERIGLIQFGSGAEVYVPQPFGLRVSIGQKVKAGQTVLATVS